VEQDGGGEKIGEQFSGVAVSVEEVGDGVKIRHVYQNYDR
jgi:hypothetical protein